MAEGCGYDWQMNTKILFLTHHTESESANRLGENILNRIQRTPE